MEHTAEFKALVEELAGAMGKQTGWVTRVLREDKRCFRTLLWQVQAFEGKHRTSEKREWRGRLYMHAPPELIPSMMHILRPPVSNPWSSIVYSPVEMAVYGMVGGERLDTTGFTDDMIARLSLIKLTCQG